MNGDRRINSERRITKTICPKCESNRICFLGITQKAPYKNSWMCLEAECDAKFETEILKEQEK